MDAWQEAVATRKRLKTEQLHTIALTRTDQVLKHMPELAILHPTPDTPHLNSLLYP